MARSPTPSCCKVNTHQYIKAVPDGNTSEVSGDGDFLAFMLASAKCKIQLLILMLASRAQLLIFCSQWLSIYPIFCFLILARSVLSVLQLVLSDCNQSDDNLVCAAHAACRRGEQSGPQKIQASWLMRWGCMRDAGMTLLRLLPTGCDWDNLAEASSSHRAHLRKLR